MSPSMTNTERTGIPSDVGHSTPCSYPSVKRQERSQFSVRKLALLCEAVQAREAKAADLPPGNVGMLCPT